MLRPDKRPRPMVLRMNVATAWRCTSRTSSLLSRRLRRQRGTPAVSGAGAAGGAYTGNQNANIKQSSQTTFDSFRLTTRHAHGRRSRDGAQPVSAERLRARRSAGIGGRFVGGRQRRGSGECGDARERPRRSRRAHHYTYVAKAEGAYLLYSTGADVGDQVGFGGQLMQGLFGSVTVQPKTAEWYRSQVTKVDLDLASTDRPPTDIPSSTTTRSIRQAIRGRASRSSRCSTRATTSSTPISPPSSPARTTAAFTCADCPEFTPTLPIPTGRSRTASSPSTITTTS